MFLDGKTFADATMVIALGITLSGEKRFLGFVETDTENAHVLTPPPCWAAGCATGLPLRLGPPTGVPRLRSSPAAQPLSETRPSGQVV